MEKYISGFRCFNKKKFRNIEHLKNDGNNFLLNNQEYDLIREIAKNISNESLILFWQFSIKTLEELDIVSNQNLSIEMFLIRLMHLKDISNISEIIEKNKDLSDNKNEDENLIKSQKSEITNDIFDLKNKTIDQIKNTIQENHPNKNIDNKDTQNLEITSFKDLLHFCNLKKEIKLKYELEKNVNLVSFENQRIEISFNEDLDKEFIKNLSSRLFDWTGDRWIISLSKKKGEPSIKEKIKNQKENFLKKAKNSKVYHQVLETFPDAELIDIEIKKDIND